MKTLYSQL